MSLNPPESSRVPREQVIGAFALVYLIWGSTYLGIRFAVATLPPFLMGGARFVLAGFILYGWLRLRGIPNPAVGHWKNAIIVGTLLLGVGNGGVNWAERTVPSGLTALIIAVTPMWFALLDWLRPGGTRPLPQTLAGIGIGFAGMVMLVWTRDTPAAGAVDRAGLVALMVASFCWAGGSLYARYTPKPESSLMGIALQMIMGGLVLCLMGSISGEWTRTDWGGVSSESLLAFVYLTLIGSLVGFTAYSWLLKVSPPSMVSTYAYVNPVIAVFLGWALAGETLNARSLSAAAVIVLGVVIITTRRTPTLPSPERTIGQADVRT